MFSREFCYAEVLLYQSFLFDTDTEYLTLKVSIVGIEEYSEQHMYMISKPSNSEMVEGKELANTMWCTKGIPN